VIAIESGGRAADDCHFQAGMVTFDAGTESHAIT